MASRTLVVGIVAVLALSGCSSLGEVMTRDPEASTPTPPAPPVIPTVSCTESERVPLDMEGAVWSHPRAAFFAGNEAEIPTSEDLEHILANDAAIVVYYDREELTLAQIAPLSNWIDEEVAAVALPAEAPEAAIEIQMGDTVTFCDGVDVAYFTQLAAERNFEGATPHDETGTGTGTGTGEE